MTIATDAPDPPEESPGPSWLPGTTTTTGTAAWPGQTVTVGPPPLVGKAYTLPPPPVVLPSLDAPLRRFKVTRQEYGSTLTHTVEVEARRIVTEDGQVKFYREPYGDCPTYACSLKGFVALQEITDTGDQ